MQPTKTRRQIHAEVQQQVDEFLRQGGTVEEVPRGISGRPYAQSPLTALFDGPIANANRQENRTPLPEVVAAIESRRHPKPPLRAAKPKPRKKVILDDFGQPLRWEWVEE